MSRSDGLLLIGAGHLGGRVVERWRERHPDAGILAETGSARRHERLQILGARTRLRQEPDPAPQANVLFCVPPSATEDYPAEAQRAARLWDGSGRLLMTSSTAVFSESEGGESDAEAEVADSARARRLLEAEKPVRATGGIVIRMAGLYDFDRGPHRVFLRQRRSPRRGDGLVNLIHYDDAAALCVCALERGSPGSLYLGSDGTPLTRQRLADIALASGLFGAASADRCSFSGTEGPIGRRCNSDSTRRQLDWQPRHESFFAWLRSCTRARP